MSFCRFNPVHIHVSYVPNVRSRSITGTLCAAHMHTAVVPAPRKYKSVLRAGECSSRHFITHRGGAHASNASIERGRA